jgi:hypothetical protein
MGHIIETCLRVSIGTMKQLSITCSIIEVIMYQAIMLYF